MSKGYSTEIDQRVMGEGIFPRFEQLSSRGGVIRPRKADEDYEPGNGSMEEWRLSKLGSNSLAEIYSAETEKSYQIYAPLDGGIPIIRDHQEGLEAELVIASPAEGPVLDETAVSGEIEEQGKATARLIGAAPAGVVTTYAKSWKGSVGGGESALSGIAEFDGPDYLAIELDYSPPNINPVAWATITNTTRQVTAEVLFAAVLYQSSITTKRAVAVIRDSGKSAEGAWTSGDSIYCYYSSLMSAGNGTMAKDEYQASVTPIFSQSETPPPQAGGWALYQLEASTGIWRKTGEAATDASITPPSRFPYADAGESALCPAWPGPMDNNYLPETMLGSLEGVQAIAVHKGCLFAASGSLIRFSEPESPRYFRKWAALDAGEHLLAIVSSGETAEVYTKTSVKYITGAPPYFELRETRITEGPSSARSIVKTDAGTFALFDDGIYAVRGGERKNISAGFNTPFIESLLDPQGAVGGASKGVYYLVDQDGSCLAYDWEEDEWFYRLFPSRPSCFLYLDDARCLVARFEGEGASHVKVANADSPVQWALSWPETGDGKLRSLPSRLCLDCEGGMTLGYLVDGETVSRRPLDGSIDIPLPVARGRFGQLTLSGEGSAQNTAVRSARWR